MELPLYQVDAFTDRLFGGNPAGVLPAGSLASRRDHAGDRGGEQRGRDGLLRREGDAYRLRSFTPTVEVELCGHATLASAYVISSFLEPGCKGMAFNSRSGRLKVTRTGDFFVLDFPSRPPAPVENPAVAGPWAARRAPCLHPHSAWPSSTAPPSWPRSRPTWPPLPL